MAAGRKGNVPAWPGSDDVDFHGTLSAIWIWARHQRLSGASRYQGPRNQAWSFVETNAKSFIPDAIDSATGDETAYDCALALIASAAEHALGGALDGKKQEGAARAGEPPGRAGGSVGARVQRSRVPGVRARRLCARRR